MTGHDSSSENAVDYKKQNANVSSGSGSLWTVQDVARYLRLKPETVRAKAKRGELPAVKLGRLWRFSWKRLEDWLGGQVNKHEQEENGQESKRANGNMSEPANQRAGE